MSNLKDKILEEFREKFVVKIVDLQFVGVECKGKHSFISAKDVETFISQSIDRVVEENEKKTIIFATDLCSAIGHMSGCGHPYEYLTKKYGVKAEKLINSLQPKREERKNV